MYRFLPIHCDYLLTRSDRPLSQQFVILALTDRGQSVIRSPEEILRATVVELAGGARRLGDGEHRSVEL
jgi:hypothetical protein